MVPSSIFLLGICLVIAGARSSKHWSISIAFFLLLTCFAMCSDGLYLYRCGENKMATEENRNLYLILLFGEVPKATIELPCMCQAQGKGYVTIVSRPRRNRYSPIRRIPDWPKNDLNRCSRPSEWTIFLSKASVMERHMPWPPRHVLVALGAIECSFSTRTNLSRVWLHLEC